MINCPRTFHSNFEDDNRVCYLFLDLKHIDELDLPINKSGDCISHVIIDINGDIYPCCNNFIGKIGNIHTNNITEIITNL